MVFGTALLLNSCGSAAEVQSKWSANDEELPPTELYRYADKNSGIKYGFRNNTTHVMIDAMIPGRREQVKLLQSGMKIVLDTTGKRKNDVWLQFPLKGATDEMNEEINARIKAGGVSPAEIRAQTAEMIANLPREGAFHISERFVQFNLDEPEAPCTAKLRLDDTGVLRYYMAIPYTELPLLNISAAKKLSIGFIIPGLDAPDSAGGPPGGGAGNPMPTSARGRPGQNMGGTSARNMAMMSSGNNNSVMTSPVKIWLKPVWADQ